jgi:hypothetical protein
VARPRRPRGRTDGLSPAAALRRLTVRERPGVDGVEPEPVDEAPHRADGEAVVSGGRRRELVVDAVDRLPAAEADLLAPLDEGERQRLHALLRRLADGVELCPAPDGDALT